MLLGEPPRTPYDLNFRLLGFPVRVHPFFWLIAVLLGLQSPDAIALIAWIVAVFVSILFHEFGHAVAIRAYGFRPWITLYGMGGLASYDPNDSHDDRGHAPLAQIVISLAGPGAGFLLAVGICGAILLSGHRVQFALGGLYGIAIAMDQVGSMQLTQFLYVMLFINIIWGAVNLLPIYPLDGGKIAREILTLGRPQEGVRQSLMLSAVAAAAMAAVGLLAWKSLWIAFFFGYLAYTSYATLKAYGRQAW